ncbi:hypothetical protein TVAG_111130 [Trichomonas vaginalis G3]|uniref:Uncharacterized protein n=1 Tax=Trichomonas vaginalis (strain ATCC PRA-98 / G3) TaxID=412133 RepID=A2EZX2_TRIV3|nr:hypothetical protein TVAG_111130 [Trichomonas vaginalis G3]|eukprot:XP_001314314.1 hypothetical protein [Trichomonas vaginalis G3]
MALPKIYLIIPNEVDLILSDIEGRAERDEEMTLEEFSNLIHNFDDPNWNGIYIATMYKITFKTYECNKQKFIKSDSSQFFDICKF